ncbi:hypothetical protein GCM10010398_11080 [Streptomyces fimbriatus]
MTRSVASVGRETAFQEIVRPTRDRRVSALPVLEGGNLVVGVVFEADLLPKEEFRDSDPDRRTHLRRLPDLWKAGALSAEELMTSPAVTVRAGVTLADAAGLTARHRVKRLPVVDERGALEGVVSRADLLEVFLRDDEDLAEQVRREVVAHLFPGPGSAVRVEVRDGVVRLVGRVRDTALAPAAARLIRAVEGVVAVEFAPTGVPTGAGRRGLWPGHPARSVAMRRSASRAQGPDDGHLAGDRPVLAADGDRHRELGATARVQFGHDLRGRAAEGRGGGDGPHRQLLVGDLGADGQRHGARELVPERGEHDRAARRLAEREHRTGVRPAHVVVVLALVRQGHHGPLRCGLQELEVEGTGHGHRGGEHVADGHLVCAHARTLPVSSIRWPGPVTPAARTTVRTAGTGPPAARAARRAASLPSCYVPVKGR